MNTTYDIYEEIDRMEPIDVSDKFPGCKAAEAKGFNVLILHHLDKKVKTLDGTLNNHELEHRWLSKPILTEADVKNENYICVNGQDFTYYRSKDLKKDVSLFKQFRLF